MKMDFPGGTVVQNLPINAKDTRDMGSIPGVRRFPVEGNSNPLQNSCRDNNTLDRGAWWVTVHGASKSRT